MPSRFAKRAAVSGFVAAALATIAGALLSPEYSVTAFSLISRAVAYVAAVFGLGVIATQLGSLVPREEFNARSEDIAIQTATVALWFPPLMMFWLQRSWFALVIFVVLALHAARWVAFLGVESSTSLLKSREASTECHAFSLLKRDFPFGSSVLGAFMVEGSIFAALDDHLALAGLLYLAGTMAVVYRSFQMFGDLPAISERDSTRSVVAVLIASTFLIVFAWLPHLVQSAAVGGGHPPASGESSNAQVKTLGNGIDQSKNRHRYASALEWVRSLFRSERPGSRGDSFAIAKRLLDSTFPGNSKPTHGPQKAALSANVAAMMIMGPVFPGVELYPKAQPHTRLVAPSPLGESGVGISHTDALSIPFEGVYWFWRGPSEAPPSNSVVMRGSPSAQFFRSTDGDGMSMEARQNLGFSVDPRSYGAIELDIQNADPFPNSVSILLKVRNTALPEKPAKSLGMENIVTPVSSEASAITQTLRFRLPSKLGMGSFDELTVSYYLKGTRSNRSARIAIERFRFVPRR